jgi:phytoene desaturase
MPHVYEAEFRALGVSLHERIQLTRVDPTYHLVFDDGQQLSLTSDMKCMREQLEAIQSGSFDGLLRYLQEGSRHYDLVVNKLVNRNFRGASDLLNIEMLSLIFRLKPLIKHYRNMSQYFNEPRLKAAFTFQDVYMGLSPFEAPATFSMMPYTELAHGVWYPKGGMYSIVETLVELARDAGVELRFNSPVDRIETGSSRAHGATLADGSRLEADVVLANADLPYVYEQLLPRDGVVKALSRKQFSCSVISFFWGLDKRYEALGGHSLFLADDYRENFEQIVRDLSLPSNPSVYVHAPARLDPSMAPTDQDTVTAIVPVGHLNVDGGQNWTDLRDRARQQIFRRLATLGIADMQSHIKFEAVYTPVSWARHYNLAKGSTHGLSHTLTQMGPYRPSNRHGRYGNVYFVGASTHPGTGVPTAMVSGRLVAERIYKEQRS